MDTIVKALKQIDPNAEGNTVAEVLKNMNLGGGGGGSFIANYVYGDSSTTLDKTYAEFKSAMLEGKTLYTCQDNSFNDPQYGYTLYEYYIVTSLYEKDSAEGNYQITTTNGSFASATADGVLTLSE